MNFHQINEKTTNNVIIQKTGYDQVVLARSVINSTQVGEDTYYTSTAHYSQYR